MQERTTTGALAREAVTLVLLAGYSNSLGSFFSVMAANTATP
jgi:hypothetical protein